MMYIEQHLIGRKCFSPLQNCKICRAAFISKSRAFTLKAPTSDRPYVAIGIILKIIQGVRKGFKNKH